MRSKITCNVLCEKPRSKEIRSLIEEYTKRISSVNLIFVKDVEKSLSSHDNIILLDERGVEMSSAGFSHFLSQTTYTLAVGPAQGFSADAKKKYKSMKLSSMTFPHEFAALMLIEQIYRAHTILAGIPYHKD